MFYKTILLFSIFFSFFIVGFSQTSMPVVEWARTYGGAQLDIGSTIVVTSDNKYVICGTTSSQDKDTLRRPTGWDGLIMKTDANGNVIWKKIYGGNGEDALDKIIQTVDGGFMVCGAEVSNDGIFSTNKGDYDAWIMKLDSLGNFQWQKTYGGSGIDIARGIIQDDQSNYVFIVNSDSKDGDFNDTSKVGTVWLVKINNKGNIIWKRKYGGSDINDNGLNLIKYDNKSYLMVGETRSNDGDFKNSKGNFIMKVDSAGNTMWLKSPGSPYDSVSIFNGYNSVILTKDGNIMALGYAYAYYQVINHAQLDYLLTKMDKDGNVIWSKMYGGTLFDVGKTLLELPSGEFIAVGITYSNDGDIDPHCRYGMEEDIWTIKLDSIGQIIWKICLGGSKDDYTYEGSASLAKDGAILITGYTTSNDGIFSKNYGSYDIPIIKLRDLLKTDIDNTNYLQNFKCYPNPVSSNLTIENNSESVLKIRLINSLGQVILNNSYSIGTYQLDCQQLPNGFYQLNVSSTNNAFISKKIIIQK